MRARVHLKLLNDKWLQITVSDEGAGFDPDYSIGEGGRGFGLFSIRERLSFMKGKMEIASAPGKGSCFTLMVPTQQTADGAKSFPSESQCPHPVQEAQVSSDEGAIRVLLADDHTLFRDGIARLLEREPDIEVVGQAGDGLQAIELARKLTPHVILMDIGMPHVSGIEATRVIHQEAPHIRIIGLSMYEDRERILVMRNVGAADYRVKDCAIADLLAAVRHPSGSCDCHYHGAAKSV
jgi:CheY-like chemotaxis protein